MGVPPVPPRRPLPAAASPGATVLRPRNIVVRYGAVVAVRGVDLDLAGGEVTALMGRNGSGKSSLLWALQGSGPRQSGTVDVGGADPSIAFAGQGPGPRRARAPDAGRSALPGHGGPGVRAGRPGVGRRLTAGPAQALLDRLGPGIPPAMHPRDLSEGQRLSLVLAVQLAAAPDLILLDEPTRGLDYPAKQSLIAIIDQLAGRGPIGGRLHP